MRHFPSQCAQLNAEAGWLVSCVTRHRPSPGKRAKASPHSRVRTTSVGTPDASPMPPLRRAATARSSADISRGST